MNSNKFFIALTGVLLSAFTLLSAATVNDLRVEYLKNPVGIDVQHPRFSWKMEASERGAFQTAYEITVSTDPAGETPVWNSGQVASGESVHIEYTGNDLLPATRYYWKVKVWDQDEQEITSAEPAFFETGLMNAGWSGAQWIKNTTKIQGASDGTSNNFTIEMDFKIATAAAGPVFAAKDKENFFMWQINIATEGKTFFRPHVWRANNPACLAEIDITNIIHVERNTVHALRIEVEGSIARTYIDDLEVDVRQNPNDEDYPNGLLGFRASNEDASYDNIKITTDSGVSFEEDFSDPSKSTFWEATIESGWLRHTSNNGLIAWQKTLRDNIINYSLEMDFEIEDVSAGIVFAARDHGSFFMWQVNIDNNPGRTLLRPHSWLNGSVAGHGDIDITDIVSIAKGTVHHLRIDVNGDKASTFIDNLPVDVDRVNPRGGNYGYGTIGVGFRADRSESYVAEKAYYDNIVVRAEIDGNEEDFFKENFSDPENYAFTYGTITPDGRLYVVGITDNSSSHYSWQQDTSTDLHFMLEADFTLIKDNAAIIFSASDKSHFYMWSIDTFDDPAQPILRRHYNDGGTWRDVVDVPLGDHFTKAELLNHEHHLKIEVIGNRIKTFIDGILADTYTDLRNQLLSGGIGFRAFKGNDTEEIACWDNIVVTDYREGQPVVTFSEDFEGGNNPFGGGEIVDVEGNAKFRMFTSNEETCAFEDSMNGIPMFRTEFDLNREIASARIYTSGLGVYDVFVNGQRVGADEFKPGWTDYTQTVFYSTYDVKDLLRQGDNAVGASVSSGWWNGAIAHGKYGNPALGFLAKLVVEYTDDSSEIVVTDPATWLTTTNGPVRTGDIYNGETYDARKETNWSAPGFDDTAWFQCALNTDFRGDVKAFTGPTVQVRPELQRTPRQIKKYNGITATGTTHGMINVTETHEAPALITLNAGETAVYDLGQNMAGWVKFKVKGVAGTKLTVRFAEMLNDDGSASRGNDGPGGSLYRIALRGAEATLAYTLKGDPEGEEFHPSTTFFGFRYCDVTATKPLEIQSLTGEVVGSVTEEGSSFVTDHSAVNQLYSNIKWGQRSNFLSVPTDCPQRDERLGWTGDIQIFGRTATYNADVAAFFRKWMGDLRNGQRADGAYPVVAPTNWPPEYGSAAWADAGIVIPWNTYLMYNDKGILEENYESMEKYMGFLTTQAGGADRSAYGDWLAFEETDHPYINVCYYAYVALLMEKISNALSEAENDDYAQKAASYQTLYDNIKAEFQTRYIGTNGLLTINTQTAYLLALKLDLLPAEYRQTGVDRLRELIVNNGNKLTTGFVGTGILNQTLSEVGLTDIAYNLLLQRNNPSWLYSVDQGATTIWERWNSYTKETGFGDVSMNSFNHYAYGAVGEWMYRYMAGINPDEGNPGFKHIHISPLPDFRKVRPVGQDGIAKADASYNSYYGAIRSAWEIKGDTVKYNITVPANTTATLTLILNDDDNGVYESGAPVNEVDGVTTFRQEDGKAIIELQSGTYSFDVYKKKGLSIAPRLTDNDRFSVYPNPVEAVLNIQTTGKVSDMQIYTNSGLLVYSQRSDAPVNMQPFAPGVYFVRINTAKQPEVVKIVKKWRGL
jgi:alpha-L-rhamnosidase